MITFLIKQPPDISTPRWSGTAVASAWLSTETREPFTWQNC